MQRSIGLEISRTPWQAETRILAADRLLFRSTRYSFIAHKQHHTFYGIRKMESARFEVMAAFSGRLHGHKYVFPVAAWLLEEAIGRPVTQPEIRKALVHAESNRIFEALERLVAIGAVRELPKTAGRRYFETVSNPFWNFVSAEIRSLDAEIPSSAA